MKNISWKDGESNLLPVQNEQSSDNSNEKNQPGKVVIYDECGDTLWDEVLAQAEIKTIENNG